MRKITLIILAITIICSGFVNAFAITGNQIIAKIDNAMTTKSSKSKVIMKVYSGTGSYRTIKMTTYTRGMNLSYSYYTYPRNIKGMKYLSRFDSIWIFYPLTGRVRKLPDHMQKRPISGVGGDFSARDMKNSEWKKNYRGKLIKETQLEYIVEAKGIKRNTYKKIILYVRKSNYIPSKIEYFNDNLRKFKILYLKKLKKISGKWIATFMEMFNYDRDAKTTITQKNIKINISVPKRYFSVSNLRR